MWTSERSIVANRADSRSSDVDRPVGGQRLFDAGVLALGFAFLPELIFGSHAGLLEPHPGWVAVAVLAARDGGGGLLSGLLACACGLGLGAALSGAGFAAPFARLGTAADLIAFGGCLAVSWVGSWHSRRHALLAEQLRLVSDRAARSQAVAGTLQDVVVTLRRRFDRASTSLSFLRNAAGRLEGDDPRVAAGAAADLALARSGAHAVQVHVGVNGLRRLLAVRDARGMTGVAPLALPDADRVVPIFIGKDQVGSITLWGIPSGAPDEATMRDLEVVASWCGPALSSYRGRARATRVRLVGAR